MKCHGPRLVLLVAAVTAWGQKPVPAVSGDEALTRLIEGNQRYVKHKERHPDQSLARRKELTATQHPFAVILGCADSRVPPELLFDQGLGDLFVLRVAGNVVDDDILGTIEYGVEHLGTRLIVVLGHEKCGAVSAAVEGVKEPGHLTALVQAIQRSVDATRNDPGDKVHNCVIANVRSVAGQIRESEPVLKEAIQGNGLQVVAAVVALDTGKVTLLDRAHP
jgi:carbonic anhydrase